MADGSAADGLGPRMDGQQSQPVFTLTHLFDLLARVDKDLVDCAVDWALVGGLAVGARTEPRFTRDLDVVVSTKSDADAERLVMSMRSRGYQINLVLEQARTGRLATVRLLPAGDDRLVDLLFASSGIESDIVDRSDRLEVAPGLSLLVANVGHLIAMKVLSRDDRTRPQDKADLVALLKIASPSDLTMARAAVERIVAQGTHRGRPLLEELALTVSELSPSS